jgi:hypothetical protein
MIAAVFYAHMIPALFPKRAPLRLLVLGGACFGAGLGTQVQAWKAFVRDWHIASEGTVSARWVCRRDSDAETVSCPQSQLLNRESQDNVLTVRNPREKEEQDVQSRGKIKIKYAKM